MKRWRRKYSKPVDANGTDDFDALAAGIVYELNNIEEHQRDISVDDVIRRIRAELHNHTVRHTMANGKDLSMRYRG